MTALSTRLSVTDLSHRILEMATTGVYRESLFDTFKPVATKRQIRDAIALAKQVGLRSDPTLRDVDLGTYYHVDHEALQSFQTTAQSVSFEAGEDVSARILELTQTLQTMVRVASGVAIALLLVGALCILQGHIETAAVFWSSALCAAGIWGIQKQMAKPFV
ncbi:MAG: hypothetical protein AAF152_01950 [Cyanobacteria bacterium P01_A01_bin.114]